MQSFSQLTKVYGRSGASEIFDLLNTRFFFRSPSAEIARLVSQELGEEDIDESRENYSYGANSVRDGISIGNQRVTRPIVAYPQILELKDLSCFLRLPGHYPITQLSLKLESRAAHHPGFIERALCLPTCLSEVEEETLAPDESSSTRITIDSVKTRERPHDEALLHYVD